jgi:hypothetical protein
MKHANGMCSGAMLYILSFIKGIQKLTGGIRSHRYHSELIGLVLIFQNKESRLKTELFNI